MKSTPPTTELFSRLATSHGGETLARGITFYDAAGATSSRLSGLISGDDVRVYYLGVHDGQIDRIPIRTSLVHELFGHAWWCWRGLVSDEHSPAAMISLSDRVMSPFAPVYYTGSVDDWRRKILGDTGRRSRTLFVSSEFCINAWAHLRGLIQTGAAIRATDRNTLEAWRRLNWNYEAMKAVPINPANPADGFPVADFPVSATTRNLGDRLIAGIANVRASSRSTWPAFFDFTQSAEGAVATNGPDDVGVHIEPAPQQRLQQDSNNALYAYTLRSEIRGLGR